MNFTFRTDIGRVRSHNEDSGGVFKNQIGLLAIVADGMGGHRAGDVASAMTIDYFRQIWEKEQEINSVVEAEKWLAEHFEKLNTELYTHAQQHEECHGMGTTIVIALCTEEFISIAHIGDSRAYVFNEFGFNLKTNDHSLVQELVRNGQISEEEAEHHPRRNVLLRAMGTEKEIKMETTTLQVEEDQLILLCSDGLTNKLSTEDLKWQIEKGDSLSERADGLIKLANERGGEDNITVAIVQYGGPEQ
ncbi:Stp1/IreP family PP2C-type Ser/Thr phosphatase [Alkalihalobacillus deserti]|uniref:Stp1/IreP family PP2C-type Ser/Thr phosphatase n=1 Tax=Alkalihalobacillus deserti TaxID=2879466 RepID=UPI001D137FF8|nr:Stp1/IreP family PP2C-type Ser/Thr phosphatase [Alkalihalobacillus deserti]